MHPTYPVPSHSPHGKLVRYPHPVSGGATIVRVERDEQGFGIVRQVAVQKPNQQSDFKDCQFGSL